MAATPTSMDAALKEVFTEENIAEQLYSLTPLLDRIRKLKNPTQIGQQAQTTVHVGRNHGYTALPAAGGTLNTAGQQAMAQAVWNYTHHNMPIKIQGSIISQTKNKTLSIAEAIDTEVSGAITDLNRELTRQLFLAGDARITACVSTTTSNTLLLNVADGFDAIERGWLEVGSVIDVGSSSNEVSVADAVTITTVTESETAPSVVISGSTVSAATTDFVSIANARSGATIYEMNGLGNVVDSATTLGALTVAAQSGWASYEDSTAQALTLPLMLKAQRKVHQKTGRAPNYVIMGLKQQANFYSLLQAQTRFTGDTGQGAGNVSAPKWNEMEIHADPDCKNAQMYFLTIEDLELITDGNPSWQSDITGGKVLEWIQGEDAFGGRLNCRIQLGASRRNSHAKMTGLT